MSKDLIRKILKILHFDLTKNQQYDRATQQIMKRVIRSNSNCIDVGCHKGEMLDLMLKYAPKGNHFAFEPIPDYYKQLKQKSITLWIEFTASYRLPRISLAAFKLRYYRYLKISAVASSFFLYLQPSKVDVA